MQETQETQVRSLRPEDPLEEETATHSSVLAWRIPWTKEPGGLQSMGVTKESDRTEHTATWGLYPVSLNPELPQGSLAHHPWWLQELMTQFSSVAQSRLTLCDPMDCSTPSLPVHHQLPEFTQTLAH